jgi:hypothetical protein
MTRGRGAPVPRPRFRLMTTGPRARFELASAKPRPVCLDPVASDQPLGLAQRDLPGACPRASSSRGVWDEDEHRDVVSLTHVPGISPLLLQRGSEMTMTRTAARVVHDRAARLSESDEAQPHHDRLTAMSRMIAFAPVLALLPVLLVAGILVVAAPGLVIIVLGAGFYGSLALVGVVGAAAKTRLDAARSRAPRDHTSSAPARPSRPGYRPAGVGAPALQTALRGPVTGGPARRVAAAAALQPTAEDRAAQRRRPPAA